MDTALLRQLGTIDQIAGIRESVLLRGRSAGTRIAEFYNAAGLRFTVVPDCGMNLYDFSYRGWKTTIILCCKSLSSWTPPA